MAVRAHLSYRRLSGDVALEWGALVADATLRSSIMFKRSFDLAAMAALIVLGATIRADAQYAPAPNQQPSYQVAQPIGAPTCRPRPARGFLEALVNLTDDPPCSAGYVANLPPVNPPDNVQPAPDRNTRAAAAPDDDGRYVEPVRHRAHPRARVSHHRHTHRVAARDDDRSENAGKGSRTIYGTAILKSDGSDRLEITIVRKKPD